MERMHVFFMCRSLTMAQKAAYILQNAGIFASVAKAPQSANPGGCTYGVKLAQRNGERARSVLEESGIEIEKALEMPSLTQRGARL